MKKIFVPLSAAILAAALIIYSKSDNKALFDQNIEALSYIEHFWVECIPNPQKHCPDVVVNDQNKDEVRPNAEYYPCPF